MFSITNGVDVFEVTQEEFEQALRMVRKNRAVEVEALIKRLAESIGVAETKAMVRRILQSLN